MKNIFTKIKKFIKEHDNFLVTTHVSPEGDALGSQFAFAHFLGQIGKNYSIVNNELPPHEYDFMEEVKEITTKPRFRNYDAMVVLDCADKTRIGNVAQLLNKKGVEVLNIDHHISNTNFGHINCVDTGSSSACELLYLLFKDMGAKIDKKIAFNLYLGIMTDTGSFRHTNTTSRTHAIVSELLKWGMDVSGIYKNVYGNLDYNDLKLVNKVLLNLKKDKTGKVAWVKLTRGILDKYNSFIDLTDNILSLLRLVKGLEVCMIFKENKDTSDIRVNFRSQGKVNVSKIAQHFDGGGHRSASGATLKNMTITEAEKKVVSIVKKAIG